MLHDEQRVGRRQRGGSSGRGSPSDAGDDIAVVLEDSQEGGAGDSDADVM